MSESADRGSAQSRRILLVDDVSHVAEALREMLVAFGHTVEVVPGGEEALRTYQPEKFDLVITDYTMPRMNGADLTQAIRARSPKQLILLMVSPSQADTAKIADSARANYLLPKPFSVKEFQAALASLFSTDHQAA